MAIRKIQTGLRIHEILYAKIRYLSAKEKRSLNNMIEYVLQQYVEKYEAENGEISVSDEDLYQ